MSERSQPDMSDAKKQALTSGCGHETEDGTPCLQCRPPESLVAKGLVPLEWKHVPWDALEMKKHGVIKTKDDESDALDDRLASYQDNVKRSMRVGEDESSAEMENWPYTKVTSRLTEDYVPAPPVPSDDGVQSSDSPEVAKRVWAPSKKRPSKTRLGSIERKSRKRGASKRFERRVRKSVSVTGGRGRIQVDLGVRVRIGPRTNSVSTSSRVKKMKL